MDAQQPDDVVARSPVAVDARLASGSQRDLAAARSLVERIPPRHTADPRAALDPLARARVAARLGRPEAVQLIHEALSALIEVANYHADQMHPYFYRLADSAKGIDDLVSARANELAQRFERRLAEAAGELWVGGTAHEPHASSPVRCCDRASGGGCRRLYDHVVAGMHAHARVSGSVGGLALDRPVEIVRDRRGVPHISAQNEHDLFFAQGYVEASDRLFQMDLLRRFIDGRLAEVFGRPALASDEVSARFLSPRWPKRSGARSTRNRANYSVRSATASTLRWTASRFREFRIRLPAAAVDAARYARRRDGHRNRSHRRLE